MTEIFNFILSQIGSAFGIMDEWEIFDGVSLLDFCIALLLISVVLSIVWVANKGGGDKD